MRSSKKLLSTSGFGKCQRNLSTVGHGQSGRSVVVVSAARTPIGSYQGSLKDVSATKLGATAMKVQHSVFSKCLIHHKVGRVEWDEWVSGVKWVILSKLIFLSATEYIPLRTIIQP